MFLSYYHRLWYVAGCLLLFAFKSKTMKNIKRDEQTKTNKKEQEENTYTRRRKTNKNTVHVIQSIEILDNARNNRKQERRDEETKDKIKRK